MHDEWGTLIEGRLHASSDADDVSRLFAVLAKALTATKALINQKALSHPVCFISYAWEETAVNSQRLQRVLQFIRAVLTDLGATVYLDIQDIESNLAHFMDQRIADSDRILLIGTPRWKNSIQNPERNVTREFRQIEARLGQLPELLVPLLLNGRHEEVFTADFMKTHLIRDLSGLAGERITIDALENLINALFSASDPIGILPLLYSLKRADYSLIAKEVRLSIDEMRGQRSKKQLAESCYATGNEAIARKDFAVAYHSYLSAANSGHVRAMLHVAKLKAYGQGTTLDTASALTWANKAVNAASSASQQQYAKATQQQVQRKHHEQLAKQGDTHAMQQLAGMLHRREGVSKEKHLSERQWRLSLNSSALFWLNKANETGAGDLNLQHVIEQDNQRLSQ